MEATRNIDCLSEPDIETSGPLAKRAYTEDVQVTGDIEGSVTSVVDQVDMSQPQKLIIYGGAPSADCLAKSLNIVTSTDENNMLLTGSETSGEGDKVELIQIAPLPFGDVTADGRLWHIIPSNVNITTDSVVILGDQHTALSRVGSSGDASSQLGLVNSTPNKSAPPNAPQWARLINDCERVGHYYRGWVPTEQDLDLVLTLHKQQTNSFWGTRQSPDGKRPSARMMWKSQYAPFDGIPFINCDFKHSCPARIYVKKVRKFPEYAIPTNLKKRELKHMMDNSFNALKRTGFHDRGEDRFYMQLPAVYAHEYHGYGCEISSTHHLTRTYDVSGHSYSTSSGTRLAEPVALKIREIVASGINHVTTIRKMLRKYVEKDLFDSQEPPVRHDLSFFPTVSDLKNHIHTALVDIENGALPLREASMDTLALDQEHDWTSNWASNLVPQPETVTVTLTQTDETNGHMISRVETHMTDGTTQVSNNLTAETAALLARLHPNMFPTLDGSLEVDSERLTELVQSVLLKTTSDEDDTHIEDVHPGQSSIIDSHNHLEEPPPEPAPPTEGVQLDLGLPDAAHEVAEVTLEGDAVHETCPTELTV